MGLINPTPIIILDEGVRIGVVQRINYVGAGVVASVGAGLAHVSISGGGGGMATHAFLTEWHGHPASASGAVLTSLGSGAIPTYTSVVAAAATHAWLTAHGHPISASGALMTSLGSGAIPTFTSFLHAAAHGSNSADAVGIFSLVGTLNAAQHPIAQHHRGGAMALNLGTLAGRLIGTQHLIVDHYTGGIAPLTLGSLPGTLVASQHPDTQHLVGGISVLQHKRTPMWYLAATLSVGSQLSAHIMADGPWVFVDVVARCELQPTGGNLHFELMMDKTVAVFASLPVIIAGSQGIASYSFGTTGVASGSWLSFNITEFSSLAGDLTVQLICKEPVIA